MIPNMSLSESRLRLIGAVLALMLAFLCLLGAFFFLKDYSLEFLFACLGLTLLSAFMFFEAKKNWCVVKAVLGQGQKQETRFPSKQPHHNKNLK